MNSGAGASGSDAVGAGNKANGAGGVSGVRDAVAAGGTTFGCAGMGAASFVPKTNSSSALSSGLRFFAVMTILP